MSFDDVNAGLTNLDSVTVRNLLDSCSTILKYQTPDKACQQFFLDLEVIVKHSSGRNEVSSLIVEQLQQTYFHNQNEDLSSKQLPSDNATYLESYRAIGKLKELDELIKSLQSKKDHIYNCILNLADDAEEAERQSVSSSFDSTVIAVAANNHKTFQVKVEPGTQTADPVPTAKTHEERSQHRERNIKEVTSGVSDPFICHFVFPKGKINLEPQGFTSHKCHESVTSVKVCHSVVVCGCINGDVAVYNLIDGTPLLVKNIHSSAITSLVQWNNYCYSASYDSSIKMFDPRSVIIKKTAFPLKPLQCMIEIAGILFVGSTDGCIYKINARSLTSIKSSFQVNRGFVAMEELRIHGSSALAILCCDGKLSIRSCDLDIIASIKLDAPGVALGSIVVNHKPMLFIRAANEIYDNHLYLIYELGGKLLVKFLKDADYFGCISWAESSFVLHKRGLMWIGNISSNKWYEINLHFQDDIALSSVFKNKIAVVSVTGSVSIFHVDSSLIMC